MGASKNFNTVFRGAGVVAVWQRNFQVWRKLMVPSLLSNFGEPVLYLLVLGYGFGRMVGHVGGISYTEFLATGILCSSAMTAASFEAMYSAYTRLNIQHTWAAMLATPLSVDDVVLGEILWAGTKALINTSAILVVAACLGLVHGWWALFVLPIAFLTGLTFASAALVVTAYARSYDFFMYYFTLILTPLLLLSGVFFPLSELPKDLRLVVGIFPLVHSIRLIRPLVTGGVPSRIVLNVAVLLIYLTGGILLSIRLFRRKILA